MSTNNVVDYKIQETALYNGKPVTVLSERNGYVTVRDESTGQEFSVSKASLSRTSLYSYLSSPDYEQRREESQKKINEDIAKGKEAEKEQQALRNRKTDVVAWLTYFLRKKGVVTRSQLNTDERKEFDPKYYEKYELAMQATQCGNEAMSWFNAATREAYNMRYLG